MKAAQPKIGGRRQEARGCEERCRKKETEEVFLKKVMPDLFGQPEHPNENTGRNYAPVAQDGSTGNKFSENIEYMI